MPRTKSARTPGSASPSGGGDLPPDAGQASGALCFAGCGEALGREEEIFSRLTARIKELQARIEAAERENLELDGYYQGQFLPALKALGEAMMALAMRLEESAARQRSGKAAGRLLKRVIPALLQEASRFAEPTPEASVLYDAYTRQSRRDPQREVARDRVDETVVEDPPESHERLPDGAEEARRHRRKSKRTREREATERRKDELKQRSLRDVYIALAKVLHPDIEPDPARKREKEAFLKRVTAAYREGNLVELLHLELAWLEGGGVRNASADKLTLYIELLKDQERHLDAACSQAERRFREAYPFARGTIRAFRRILAQERTEAEIETSRLARLAARLEVEPGFLEDCLALLWEDLQATR